jgi:hypothetical protein
LWWWWDWMYSCSYGIRNFVLLMCFNSSIVLCIRVYCWGCAVRMPIGSYCFWCIRYSLGNVASSCVLSVRCTTCGKCYNWFCRFRFCHSLGWCCQSFVSWGVLLYWCFWMLFYCLCFSIDWLFYVFVGCNM